MDKEEQQKPLEVETVVNSSEEKVDDNNQADVEQAVEEKKEEVELTPEEKIKELEDKLARTFAEMENQRRRFEKEKEDAFEYGGTSFAREALNKTLEHLDIINKDLISIFTKNNIKPIDCLNKKLDPNLHQAMMEIEDDQKEPGTIIQEIQKGFMIKNRLLRPSLVGVSKKTQTEDKESTENVENKENN